jgi:hypothetical protein
VILTAANRIGTWALQYIFNCQNFSLNTLLSNRATGDSAAAHSKPPELGGARERILLRKKFPQVHLSEPVLQSEVISLSTY